LSFEAARVAHERHFTVVVKWTKNLFTKSVAYHTGALQPKPATWASIDFADVAQLNSWTVAQLHSWSCRWRCSCAYIS